MPSLARLKWYAARLAAMSPAEVLHRGVEWRRKRALAGEKRGWAAFDAQADGAIVAPVGLAARLRAAAQTGQTGQDASDGRETWLGLERESFNAASPPLRDGWWLLDPVSGRPWPGAQTPAFAVNVRSTGGEGEPGDVKYVWEVNRLQQLQRLAIACAAGRAEARAEGFDLIASWMRANPPFRGVNWFSGIEIALRLTSLAIFVAAVDPATFSDSERRALRRFVAAHGVWLAALPSLHSSANNHRVAEGLGLFVAGLLAPDLGAEWAREGRHILESEALRQIYADGVGGEQSPTYQAFTMELIGFGALLAQDASLRSQGAPFSRPALDRLRAGAAFLIDLQTGDGRVPAIGDDDEGRALVAAPMQEPLYAASVAAALCALTGEPCAGARPAYFREALFGAPATALRPQTFARVRAEGGYSIARFQTHGRDLHLTFDHGPLGWLKLAAHGHADALAIWLSVDDRPVFIDAGTYRYHSGRALRAALRRSQAHNTVSLPGQSQSEPSAAFSWSSRADARSVAPDANPHGFAFAGAHDGYRRRAGVTHRRDVTQTTNGLAIADRLTGGAAQMADIAFLCDPSTSVDVHGDAAVISRDGAAILRLVAPQDFAIRLVRGARESGQGVMSPRFGALVETTQIVLRGTVGAMPVVTRIEAIAPTQSGDATWAHGVEGARP